MRIWIALSVIVMSAGWSMAQSAAFAERFRVLNERSIFSRTKIVPPKDITASTPTTRESTRPSDPEFVLRGVSRANESSPYLALIEEVAAGKTKRCGVGETVNGGTITAIQLDAIELTRDGQALRIDIGRTLRGTVPSGVSGSGDSSTASSGSADSGPPPVPGSPEAKLAELRAKRLAEQQMLAK